MRPAFQRVLPSIAFGIISLAIIWPLLGSGYVLTLDMIFAEHFKSPNMSPVFMLIKLLGLFLPGMALQKLILFLILFLSGISMYHLAGSGSRTARYFSGLLYMINPFVYFRLLAGQWSLLLAYSIFPFVIMSIMAFARKKDRKSAVIAALAFTAVSFQVHFLMFSFAFLIAFALYEILVSGTERARKARRLGSACLLFLAVFFLINSYWIFSFAANEIEKGGRLEHKDYILFDTRQGISINKMTNSAMLYGFWRGGYVLPKDVIPAPVIYGIFAVILFLTIYGVMTCRSRYKVPMALLGAASLVLAAGMSSPLMAGFYEFIFTNILLMNAFREPNKFAAITALAYSYFSGFGVSGFMQERPAGRKSKAITFAAVFILFILLFAYTITIFDSFWGQLEPVNYPGDWHEANHLMNSDNESFNVVFFPWHMYMTFSWNPKQRIANPAYLFFDKPIIQGDNMEAGGIYSKSDNPDSGYIEHLLPYNISGKAILRLDAKYVILAKEADYRTYEYILEGRGMELIMNSSTLYLLRNREWGG